MAELDPGRVRGVLLEVIALALVSSEMRTNSVTLSKGVCLGELGFAGSKKPVALGIVVVTLRPAT